MRADGGTKRRCQLGGIKVSESDILLAISAGSRCRIPGGRDADWNPCTCEKFEHVECIGGREIWDGKDKGLLIRSTGTVKRKKFIEAER